MKLFKKKSNNLESVLRALLDHLETKVIPASSDRCVQEHPQYPSILALSDCLSEWNLDNQAYRIDSGDYYKEDLLFPFVAHLNEEGGRFIVIHRIDQKKVTYSDELQQNAVMSEEELLKRWDGIALHAERNKDSGEKGYLLKYIQSIVEKMLIPVAIILCIAIFCLIIIARPFSISYFLLSLLKLGGTAIGILLLVHSIDSHNPLVKNLCGLAGGNDCSAILKSDAAQVTGWLSWSEIGFFYFTGSLLLLLAQPLSVNLLAWLNVMALPYTIYSITYQYRHKNWCVLCCTVQLILWAEFVVNIRSGAFNEGSAMQAFYFVPILFLMPIVGWFLLKPALYLSVQVKPLKEQLKIFKFNDDLFMQRLLSQPRHAVEETLMPIRLGDARAPITITMVSNPACVPCAQAHEFLETWMAVRNDIQVNVLFTTNSNRRDFRNRVAGHLIALSQSGDKKLAGKALKDWYRSRVTYESWALQYPVDRSDNDKIVLELQRKWCREVNITFTPTIFVNGHKIPEGYELEDLKYLL